MSDDSFEEDINEAIEWRVSDEATALSDRKLLEEIYRMLCIVDIRERLAFYEGEGRHSLASKARRTADKPLGGLFERPYDEAADARGSYDEAVRAIGERVKAGEPVPDFFLPTAVKEG